MHSLHRRAHGHAPAGTAPTTGWVMNWGLPYDLMVWVIDKVSGGKLRGFHQRALELAAPRPGERVLEVGCGTGSLALAAKRRVGDTGRVAGIDPGPRQIARARSRASRDKLAVDFQVGLIEELAFPDRSFDVVLSSLMMHHLPDDLKRRGLAEIARVLAPGGRLVIVDFKRPAPRRGKPATLGAGAIGIEELGPIVEQAGFVEIESGPVPAPRMPGLAGAGWLLARIGAQPSAA